MLNVRDVEDGMICMILVVCPNQNRKEEVVKMKESFVGRCPNCEKEHIQFVKAEVKDYVKCPECDFMIEKKSLVRVLQV